jgi:signal transduction histidine kinase
MISWVARRAGWGASALLALLLIVNALLADATGDLGALSDTVWLLAFSTFAVVGGLVIRHQSANPVGWLFVAAGLGTVMGSLLTSFALWVDTPAFATAGLLCFGTAWVLGTTYPLFLFPNGRLPSRRWRPVLPVTGALLAVTCVAIVATGFQATAEAAETVTDLCVLGSVVLALAGIVSLLIRWYTGDEATRRQLAWLAMGVLLIVALATIELTLSQMLGPQDDRGAFFEAACVATLPLVTYVAIVRHRLFDIELVLRRSIVYALLVGTVLAAYAGSLMAVSRLLDDADRGVGASLVASAVVAVGLSPVKERLERGVDWALFGDRRRPERPLAALGARAEAAADGADVLAAAAATVRSALRVPHVRIDLVGREAVEVGDPVADPFEVSLISHGETEGRLLVGRREPGDDFDSREKALLADLGRQVALLARATRLTDALRRSRERSVAAREQERLRLRRDLHDGLGPVLAGLTLQLDALHGFLDPKGEALFTRIKAELRRCVGDVRRAVEGLRPADLDQLGLAGVVAEQARSLSASGVAVQVDCPLGLAIAGPAAEVAAYRIVTEAMTNVIRHARASQCRVSIAKVGSQLRISVEDNGCGFDPGRATAGVGLASMRERADELGGKLRVIALAQGGTGILALIPAGV